MAWDAEAIVVNDRKFKGRGNRATGDEFAAAPNIDHMQDYVRKDLTDWLEWLRDDIGFDGWRWALQGNIANISISFTTDRADGHVSFTLHQHASNVVLETEQVDRLTLQWT